MSSAGNPIPIPTYPPFSLPRILVTTDMNEPAFFGPPTNLGSRYHPHCRDKQRIPTSGRVGHTDSRNSRLFTQPITHQAFSEGFSIFGTTSPHSIPLSSVFQSTQDSAFSPTLPTPNRFQGHIEVHPNSDVSLIFNINSNSTSNYIVSNAQGTAKIPCEITVHFPQTKRPLLTDSVANGKSH